jgi:hypothetical protein
MKPATHILLPAIAAGLLAETSPAAANDRDLSGASGKWVEIFGAAAYNGSCRSEGARP